MFCPKCGTILMPKKDGKKTIVRCSCGYSDKDAKPLELKENLHKDTKKFEVVNEDEQTLPLTEVECPKCGHGKAYYWLVQTRAGDEPETRFFKCQKCRNVWRDAT